jgi:UDP-glucose 4-epimerase
LKTLVTGGAGFIGSHLVDLLILEGHDVAVVDNLATGDQHHVNPAARFHRLDIRATTFERVLRVEHPEVVFHQAAQMSVKASTDDPCYDAQINVLGLVNVLEGCVAAGVRKVVFASSGATYGNPLYLPIDEEHPQWPASPYAITKLAGEHYLAYYRHARGLEYTVLRYGNVYGPRQDPRSEAGVVAIFAQNLLNGLRPTIHWDGEQVRDYVYVADVVRANLLAAEVPAGDGRAYCIGTGIGTTVNQVFAAMSRLLRSDVSPLRSSRRAGDLRTAYFDTRRAHRELGWQATVQLAEGLEQTLAYGGRPPAVAAAPMAV